MKSFELEFDAETVARLESLGEHGQETALGNELLGMALVEAFQKMKKAQETIYNNLSR